MTIILNSHGASDHPDVGIPFFTAFNVQWGELRTLKRSWTRQ